MRLGERDDVGREAERLVGEGRARCGRSPVWTSSNMSRAPALAAQALGRREVLGDRRPHAALPLHDLEHHRGDGVVERLVERGDVVERHVDEALGQRRERLLLARLARGGKRGQRAAVERPQRASRPCTRRAWRRPAQRRASLMAPSFASAPEFAKKTLIPPPEQPHDVAGELGAVLDVEEVASRARACAACSAIAAVTAGCAWPRLTAPMPETKSRYSRALVVVEAHALAAHEHAPACARRSA